MLEKVARSASPATSCRTQTLTWPFVIHWQIQRRAGWLQSRLSNSLLSQILGVFQNFSSCRMKRGRWRELLQRVKSKREEQGYRFQGLVFDPPHYHVDSSGEVFSQHPRRSCGDSRQWPFQLYSSCGSKLRGYEKGEVEFITRCECFQHTVSHIMLRSDLARRASRCMMDLMLAVTLWVFSSQAG